MSKACIKLVDCNNDLQYFYLDTEDENEKNQKIFDICIGLLHELKEKRHVISFNVIDNDELKQCKKIGLYIQGYNELKMFFCVHILGLP